MLRMQMITHMANMCMRVLLASKQRLDSGLDLLEGRVVVSLGGLRIRFHGGTSAVGVALRL